MDRKLATIRSIDSIRDVLNADRLEVATFGGWEVVVNRGLYQPNQLVIYCEPDSFIPHDLAPYLTKPGSTPRTFRGVQGERLRTIKMRGQISQGLVLPITSIPADTHIEEGMDVTELLGIQLYESEAETIAKAGGIAGDQAGLFPTKYVSKSNQERCQNMVREIFATQDTWITLGSSVADVAQRVGVPEQEVLGLLAAGKWVQNDQCIQKLQKAAAIPNRKFEITEKLDGSSATMGRYEDYDFVCSRKFELKQEGKAADKNRFVRMFKESGLKSALAVIGNYAVQGELMGPGIQGQKGFHEDHLFIFDIYDTTTAQKLAPAERRAILEKLYEAGVNREKVQHVPVLYENVSLEELGITNIQALVAFADGKGLNSTNREGLVFKDALTGSFSFKAISRVWLLNEK